MYKAGNRWVLISCDKVQRLYLITEYVIVKQSLMGIIYNLSQEYFATFWKQ